MSSVLQGDCVSIMSALPAGRVDAVVTSPPYAEQRKKFYDSVSEADYPTWAVAWMAEVRRLLTPSGSVLINIREHVKNGQMSDYVLKTRLSLRADGWNECDELIWIKPGSPPVGHPKRPRRSWERILWFSPASQPWCDAKANGQPSRHIGITAKHVGANSNFASSWLAGMSPELAAGISRSRDYVSLAVGASTEKSGHPAAYPVALAEWMIKLVCPVGGRVLDPFAGSGTTAIAALRSGRDYILIEKEPKYISVINNRIAHETRQEAASSCA